VGGSGGGGGGYGSLGLFFLGGGVGWEGGGLGFRSVVFGGDSFFFSGAVGDGEGIDAFLFVRLSSSPHDCSPKSLHYLFRDFLTIHFSPASPRDVPEFSFRLGPSESSLLGFFASPFSVRKSRELF